ncbi:hypothetical protein B5807_00375 [Epicoccum nigrum]|uniref:Uncharacterized protein n=1 Tax=Epicoccum nigrum TaxID=105696 RepID=A0A1Y2MDF0_EPING|nr:hypothetical protein B5807_00375 [Epicoccum nigrum]
MGEPVQLEYPFGQTSYIAAFDDGQLAQHELKESEPSWRSEGYAKDSYVEILDHNHGESRIRRCNDAELDVVLAESPPQIRFILLLPTVHERIAEGLFKQAEADFVKAKKKAEGKEKVESDPEKTAEIYLEKEKTKDVFKKNELYDENVKDPADTQFLEGRKQDRINISRDALLKVMTKYDIAPGACSHIRGQEQIFGARTSKNEMNEVTAVEFWYAIRARAYFRQIDKDADLKMTVVTKYNVATRSTVVLLKYRSFNDLPTKLKCDLISKLKELVCQPNTELIAHNPFAVSLLHFNCTAQWYRRAARDPRDSVRHEEEKAHDISKNKKNEVEAINVRRLHLTMRNLDQDKLQLTQIIGTISSLRKQHESFYRFVKKVSAPEDRDWLYLRVEEELDRLDDQLHYLRASIEDVCGRAQRLLDLLFNLSGQQSARWSEKVGRQAMHESANMRAIAIVSMMFLPGTFVSGILGTNLFTQEELNSDSDAGSPFRASAHWWILLITILPLTALTFLGWSMWRTKSEKDIETKILNEGKEAIELQEFEPVDLKGQRRRSSIATMSSGLTRMSTMWSRQSRNGDLEKGKLPN